MLNYVKMQQRDEYRNNIVITWDLTTTCNFSCSYCPEYSHDGKYGFPEYDDVLRFLTTLSDTYKDKIIYIDLLGGEPTLWPKLIDFMKLCSDLNIRVQLLSNGSRTLRWWKKITPYLDLTILSCHYNDVDLEHFYDVTKLLAADHRIMINMAMIPEKFDDIINYSERLIDIDNVTVMIKPLRVNMGGKLFEYTDKQLEYIKNNPKLRGNMTIKAPPSQGTSEMIFTKKDGSTEMLDINVIVAEGRNSWTGWACYAGIESFTIRPDGEVWAANCPVGGAIFKITDETYKLPTNPIICDRGKCPCKTDIFLTKERV